MMIKYELFLKYQKLKSSNKDGFIFLSFSVHILCLIEKKRASSSSMAQYNFKISAMDSQITFTPS